MKAHVVKGNVFAVVFSLSGAFLRGRGGHGWLDNRSLASPSCGFCSSFRSSSSCVFVMNHVFAVAAGMGLC